MKILLIIFRTVILYSFLLVMLRVMGKREIGQLSPFDFAVAILIVELTAIPMEDIEIPLYEGMIPITVLVILEVLISFLTLKSETIRSWVNGKPAIIIKSGKIQAKELQKTRFNINDLLSHLREKDVFDVNDVEVAILEPSGNLSVIPKSQHRAVTPADLGIPTMYEGLSIPLIIDGNLHKNYLEEINLDEAWLYTELEKRGITSSKDVLFASLNTKGELYLLKKERKTNC